MDLEQGEVPPRSLDHDCLTRRQVAASLVVGTVLDAEERPQPGHVYPGPSPVDDRGEHPVHQCARGEEQVAAVLDLVDRVVVAETTAGLLVEIQAEAEAGGVDPTIADQAEAPYRLGPRQGVCDLSQGLWVVVAVKQLPSFANPRPAACPAQATNSWPLRMTWAPNGGCPLILIVT